VLTLTSIVGNIFTEKGSQILKENVFEKLQMLRNDLEKNRLRRTTDKGTDIAIILERGSRLQHGDILKQGENFVVIDQIPEKVITVKTKKVEDSFELLVLLGHIIGNRHRPISFECDSVTFPIQAESELEVFERLFKPIIEKIEMNVEERIYKPDERMNVYEH
jgi:urease accessory protein